MNKTQYICWIRNVGTEKNKRIVIACCDEKVEEIWLSTTKLYTPDLYQVTCMTCQEKASDFDWVYIGRKYNK